MSKKVVLHGTYAAWTFTGPQYATPDGTDTALYYQLAPQLFDAVEQVAPFLVAIAAIPRPVTIAQLQDIKILVPGEDRPSGPRYKKLEDISGSPLLLQSPVPPLDPVNRYDSLVWLYWSQLTSGPFRLNKAAARIGSASRPAGAALVWSIIDDGKDVRIGLTTYDELGQPNPYLTIQPCPPDEFAMMVRTDGTLSALAGL